MRSGGRELLRHGKWRSAGAFQRKRSENRAHQIRCHTDRLEQTWEIDEQIIDERRHLAEDGLVTVAITIDGSKNLISGPDITIKGLTLPRGVPAEEFVIKVQEQAR